MTDTHSEAIWQAPPPYEPTYYSPPPPLPPSGGDGGGGGGGPAPRREPRRPGWGGVLAVGLGAAVIASAVTGGVVAVVTDGDGTTSGGTPIAAKSPSAVTTPAAPGTAPNWVAAASALEQSVVSVRVDAGNGSGDEGSGVILDAKGDILTNYHVVAATGTITVALSDARVYAATVVGSDASTDLAVLKLGSVPAGLRPAAFADSSKVQVGQEVMAIGNPLGLSDTVTTGIVSALNRPVTTGGEESGQGQAQGQQQAEPVVTNAIQTDAPINPGNSGGALADSGGNVIGITSSIASLDSNGDGQAGSIGLGFAIPANEARHVADQLISSGSVSHAYLGASVGDGSATVSGEGHEAAVVKEVTAGAPADKAGLKAGDAVIAVNGQPVDGADSLVAQIRALDAGTQVTLTVVRNGSSSEITVTLAARPTGN